MPERPEKEAAPVRIDVPWHRKLSTRIAIGEAVAAGSLVIVAIVVSLWMMQRAMVGSEKAHVQTLAEMLAVGVDSGGGALDASALETRMERIARKERSIIGVKVVEPSGGRGFEWTRRGADLGDDPFVAEVSLPGGATLELFASPDRLRKVSEQLWVVVPLLVIAALVLSLGAAYLTGNRIARYIEDTTRTAAAVAGGKLSVDLLDVPTHDEVRALAETFNRLLLNLRKLRDRARGMANGDLTHGPSGSGDLERAFDVMLEGAKGLVRQIRASAIQINTASEEILATASAQERGATEQSTAVEETRRTMESLTSLGGRIRGASETVLGNAERTHHNNELIAERIGQLTSHTERIGEILEVIRDIANKTDLLALNAALEGTKAGEAGRGFSLVATQMQRLAERVMGAVRDIQSLTSDIHEATTASVLATEEGIKVAGATMGSAREIGRLIQDQQSGIEQVTLAMNDVTKVAHATVSANRDVTRAIEDLLELSRQLQHDVGTFRLDAPADAADENLRSVA